MYPILFTVGSIHVHSQAILFVAGAMLGFYIFNQEAKRTGITKRDILVGLAIVFPLTYAILYLNGVIFRWLRLGWINTEINLSPGTASFGLVLGILLSGYFAAKQRKLPVGRTLDCISPALPIAQFFGRIGCLLNGCCYGLETDSFLGLYLPGSLGVWAYRYPTQIMLALFDLMLFAWLWWYRTRKPYDGNLTLSYLLIFSAGRLVIDSFRDLPHVLGPFSPHQLASIAILLITTYFLLEHRSEKQGKQELV
jgi:phosphatidylglycerol:prolipoprotein diacylglycerol transferase